MPLFKAEYLLRITEKIFKAAGATDREAKRVAEHLVKSNLAGHDSHGIMVIPEYIEMIEKGLIRPGAKMEIVRETLTTALVEGNWGFGQVIAEKAMEIAIEKAKKAGVSAIGVRHVYHIGRLGHYSSMAAERDMIGAVICNTGPIMAPYGGRSRILGSNPISVALPASRMIFLMDFATSVVAGNKILLAHNRGEKIPLGWMLNKNGEPTNNPAEILKGGVLLPFGRHKGYALALLIDILGGALTGHGCTSSAEFKSGNGTFMAVINIRNFLPVQEFKKKVDLLFEAVKGSPTVKGAEIFIPGEPEWRAEEKRRKEGIFVSEETWKRIKKIAQKLGVNILV